MEFILANITAILTFFTKLASSGKIGIIFSVLSIWFFMMITPMLYMRKLIKAKSCDLTCFDKIKGDKTLLSIADLIKEIKINQMQLNTKIQELPNGTEVKELATANIKLGLAVDFLLKHLGN